MNSGFGKGTPKKREFRFGELIEEKLKSELKLDVIEHVQQGRAGGKFENDDFRGFKIRSHISEDYVDMYNFELKPDNKIDSISLAISQAVNYKPRANYTYVVVPNISDSTFHDSERLNTFKNLCTENKLGLISIDFEGSGDNSDFSVVIVLDAQYNEILVLQDLRYLMKKEEYSHCPLCRRIVNKELANCGWKSSTGEYCMKERLGSLAVLGTVEENKTEL